LPLTVAWKSIVDRDAVLTTTKLLADADARATAAAAAAAADAADYDEDGDWIRRDLDAERTTAGCVCVAPDCSPSLPYADSRKRRRGTFNRVTNGTAGLVYGADKAAGIDLKLSDETVTPLSSSAT